MSFVSAIKTCLTHYATFRGRARRPEFWWFMLFWTPDLFSRVFKMSQAELGGPIAVI